MNRLKDRRMELGLTQPQIAAKMDRLGYNVHVSMLSRFERGRCNPTPKQADAICAILQAPLLELYDRSDLDYHLGKRGRTERRKNPCRVSGRLTEQERKRLDHAMEIMGHDTMQEAIRAMVKTYIRTAQRRERRVHL